MWNKITHTFLYPILDGCILLSLASCKGVAPALNYQQLAQASIRLGIDIAPDDNHKLYLEAAKWIGTPYRYGGKTMKGTDCSGFTSQIYREVYRKKLERNSEEQRQINCNILKRKQLKEGDLVFFHNGKKRHKATHVGIYLKADKFVHASTQQGVIVSNLKEPYYHEHWLSGGRVK